MIRTLVALIVTLLFAHNALAQDSKTDILDGKIKPFVDKLDGRPSTAQIRELGGMVKEFNAANKAGQAEIESVNPLLLKQKLQALGVSSAAVSLCGAELHTCNEAKAYLRTMAAQCRSPVLKIVDVDEFPLTPRNLYDTKDPKLLLFATHPETQTLSEVSIAASVNPNTVAIVLCPRDSNAFGSAFRSLNLGR